ncbi:hypothetical protein ACQY0O_005598 [Thecaphora frezii]
MQNLFPFVLIALSATLASAVPLNTQSHNAGHNVVSTNDNDLIDLSNLSLNADVLKRHSQGEVNVHEGGHNVVSTNENKLVDLSDLSLNADVLKRHSQGEVNVHEGGHNVVSTNENKLVDLSDLSLNADVLKRHSQGEVNVHEGGHNVVSTNENKLLDLSDIKVGVNVLKRGTTDELLKDGISRLAHGDVLGKQLKENDVRSNVLHQRDPSYTAVHHDGGYNVVSTNDNDLIDLSDLKLGVDVLKRESSSIADILGNFQEITTKPQPLQAPVQAPTLSDIFAFSRPAKRHNPGEVNVHEGGHNVVSTNDNDLVDLSNLSLNAEVLKRHSQGEVNVHEGGHNVVSTNENKLVDLSDLKAGVKVLKKRVESDNDVDLKVAGHSLLQNVAIPKAVSENAQKSPSNVKLVKVVKRAPFTAANVLK